MVTKFQVGKVYYARSLCDHNCIYKKEIIRKTEKAVWFKDPDDPNKIKSRKIHMRDGVEGFYPFGRYSMAAFVRADSIYNPDTVKPDWET